MKITESVQPVTRTFVFAFDLEPEGGYTVTCPALPGLVSYGETLAAARGMARDAMEGLIDVLIERGEDVPESDTAEAIPRFNHLARTLRSEAESEPVFEFLTAKIIPKV